MMKLPRIAAATVLFACLANTDADAANENFCNEYAGTSVEQFNRSQELGLSVDGPRWHGAFDLHKVWCRFVSKAAAQHEIDERREVISAAEPPADAGAPPPTDSAGAPPPADAGDPPLSDYAGEPSPPGPAEEPPFAGDPPPHDPTEEPSSSDAGDPPPSDRGLTWEPAD